MGIQVIASTGVISKHETYNQIMFEIQKRMVDIENNREQKKPIDTEVAEMVLLVSKLSELENVENSIIEDRRDAVDKLFK